MAVVGDAWVRVRTFSNGLSGDIANNVRRQLRGADRDVDREGERTGARIGQAVNRGIRNDRNRKGIGDSALKMAKDFGDAFNLGIGRARMGKGLISVLIAAGPSVISAGAAMGTALAAEILTAISAIGPGLIGLGGVLAGGLAAAALNAGLLYAAFKSGAEGLKDLKKEATALLEELGKPVAEGLVSGLRDAVSTLRGALPELNDQLRTTGEKFGEIARSAADTLVSTENMSRLKSIFETNNRFLDSFKNGFNDLITAFLILLKEAAPFIDYLGQGLERFSAWAKTLLEAKEASGELNAQAQRYLDRWKQLWQTIKDFSAGISNLFKAIAPVGQTLADSMAKTAASFRAWTGDEANQTRITKFFEKAHELSSKIFEVLGKLFSAGGDAFLGADFTNLFAVLDSIATTLGPAIAKIFNQIQEAMGPHLVQIIDNIGSAFGRLADSGFIGRVADLVGTLLEKLTELLDTDLGSWVLAGAVAWSLFGGIVQPLVSVVSALAGGISLVAVAIAAAVGFFVLMWQNSQNLRDALSGLVDAVLPKFQAIWEKIEPILGRLWENIQKLAGAIGDRLAPVIEFLTPIISQLMDILGAFASYMLDQFSEVFGLLADLFSGDFEGAWEHFRTILSNFWTFVKDILEKLRLFLGSIFSGLWDLLVKVWQSIWDEVWIVLSNVGQNIYGWITDFGNWIQERWNAALETIAELWHKAWDGVTNLLPTIGNAILNGITDFGNWIQERWNAALQGISDLWNNLWQWVGDRLASAWEWIKGIANSAWQGIIDLAHYLFDPWVNFFSQLWDTITSGVSAAWEWVKNLLQNIWNGITDALHFLFDPWINFFSQLWDTITSGIHSAWEAVTSWLAARWEDIKSTASSVWNSIVSLARTIWDNVTGAIRDVVQGVVKWLSDRWDDITNAVSSAWNTLTGIVSGIWEGVKKAIVGPIEDAYNLVSGWIDDIKGIVTGAIEWISGKVDEANTKLETIVSKQAEATVAGTAIGGGAGMGTSSFMAEGGIVPAVPGGWNVVVGEAGRSERIEPLDSTGLSRRDRALISRIVGEMQRGSNSAGETVVKVMLDGRELAGIIQKVVTDNDRATARDAQRRRKVFA